jgi:hypothetical protein
MNKDNEPKEEEPENAVKQKVKKAKEDGLTQDIVNAQMSCNAALKQLMDEDALTEYV